MKTRACTHARTRTHTINTLRLFELKWILIHLFFSFLLGYKTSIFWDVEIISRSFIDRRCKKLAVRSFSSWISLLPCDIHFQLRYNDHMSRCPFICSLSRVGLAKIYPRIIYINIISKSIYFNRYMSNRKLCLILCFFNFNCMM